MEKDKGRKEKKGKYEKKHDVHWILYHILDMCLPPV